MATTIIIDPGHGGYDNGAIYNGRREKDDNLRLALAVGKILSSDGYNVIYTRTDDTYTSPTGKARIGNEAGGDYFISFHRNSAASPNLYDGVQTLIYNNQGIKVLMAQNVNDALAKFGFKNIGIEERPNLAVLRRTKMPAILIETGFINSDKDNLIFDQNFNQIAEAIASAIEKTISPTAATVDELYQILAGCYQTLPLSIENHDLLINYDFDADLYYDGEIYQLRVGNFETMEDAEEELYNMKENGIEGIIVRANPNLTLFAQDE